MGRYKVTLELGTLKFGCSDEAAENAFLACFHEALYQPESFTVTDTETGEVETIDLNYLHTSNPLYGPTEIAKTLREPFSFEVSDVFEIPGRGSVLTGQVKSGMVRVGDKVILESNSHKLSLAVALIELNRNMVNEACFTERVGLMFHGVDLTFAGHGDMLTDLK